MNVPTSALIYATLALSLFLSGCNSSGSGGLQKSMQTIQSWTATAQTVGDEWNKGNVPSPYAEQTRQAASQALQQQQDLLSNSTSIPPEQRGPVTDQIPKLRQTIDQMAASIHQENHAAVSDQLQQLDSESRSLDELSKRMGLDQQ